MGIFYAQTEVVNRTSEVLQVRFDGQDIELQPNYDKDGVLLPEVHNLIPTITVPYAKSQNVRMGSENPDDPSDYVELVGAVAKPGEKQKDDISYLEQGDALTRVDLREMLSDDPAVKDIRVAGKRNQARAKRSEAATPVNVDATTFRRA